MNEKDANIRADMRLKMIESLKGKLAKSDANEKRANDLLIECRAVLKDVSPEMVAKIDAHFADLIKQR